MSSFPITTHIKFGDGLTVTDEGNEVIRVDAASGGGGGLVNRKPRYMTGQASGTVITSVDGNNGAVPAVGAFPASAPWQGYTNDRTGADESWSQANASWTGSVFVSNQNGTWGIKANAPPGLIIYGCRAQLVSSAVGQHPGLQYFAMGAALQPKAGGSLDGHVPEDPVYQGFYGYDHTNSPMRFYVDANLQRYIVANRGVFPLPQSGSTGAITFVPVAVQNTGGDQPMAFYWQLVYIPTWF